ncbi:MAG: hypothetical protein J0L96_04410 [Anaerolineae bacterium]|nr:hypothetical protein [Anaerolineae bacterium]
MSSEAIAKPTITKNSSEFKLDVYASIPAGELVVFAVQVLQADAAPVAVEEVVSTCFRFFPHSFALKNYFYWPDSALVTRRLHDAKEKGLLKGNPTDGFETKVQGRQVAKQVAKTLGVTLPVPPKVEVIVAPAVEKKEEEKKEVVPSAPVVKEVKKKEIKKKEEKKKPVLKKQAAKPKAQAKPKKEVTAPVKKKPVPKKIVKPVAKAKVQVKQQQSKPAPKPKTLVKPVTKVVKKEERRKKEVVKVAPKAKVEKPKAQKVKAAQATQLTLSLTPPAAWKKAEAPAAKPKVKKEAPPVKVEVLAPVVVSKEEKDKAAKVVKQIERSDAYQLYRRNGKRAQIGEFDFRNMLFATMESSAETLKRNVELFKRYAGIHFRTDLIAFLEFCEESFSNLLISKVKGKK